MSRYSLKKPGPSTSRSAETKKESSKKTHSSDYSHLDANLDHVETLSYHPAKVLLPLTKGWKRERVIRGNTDKNGEPILDVYYYTPNLKKLRSMREVAKYLRQSKNTGFTSENFTFVRKCIHKGPTDRQRQAKRYEKGYRHPTSTKKMPTRSSTNRRIVKKVPLDSSGERKLLPDKINYELSKKEIKDSEPAVNKSPAISSKGNISKPSRSNVKSELALLDFKKKNVYQKRTREPRGKQHSRK